MPRPKKPRVGRPPDGDEPTTERIDLRLTPTQKREWSALAEERGTSIKGLIVEAVDLLVESDEDRREQAALADLGREVIALVKDHSHR